MAMTSRGSQRGGEAGGGGGAEKVRNVWRGDVVDGLEYKEPGWGGVHAELNPAEAAAAGLSRGCAGDSTERRTCGSLRAAVEMQMGPLVHLMSVTLMKNVIRLKETSARQNSRLRESRSYSTCFFSRLSRAVIAKTISSEPLRRTAADAVLKLRFPP